MASQKPIDANRRNSQLSAGPRTPEGKAASRFNALKHSLNARQIVIPGEDEDQLAFLIEAYVDEWDPQTPTELHLVQRLTLCDWLQRRYLRLQSELFSHFAAGDAAATHGRHLAENAGPIGLLFRQINANQRAWDKALVELRRLRDSAAPPPEDPAPVPVARRQLASFPQFSPAAHVPLASLGFDRPSPAPIPPPPTPLCD